MLRPTKPLPKRTLGTPRRSTTNHAQDDQTLLSLNVDVLLVIASYLDTLTLISFLQTCRLFYDLAIPFIIQRPAYISSTRVLSSFSGFVLKQPAARRAHLSELHISIPSHYARNLAGTNAQMSFEQALRHSPHIHTLGVSVDLADWVRSALDDHLTGVKTLAIDHGAETMPVLPRSQLVTLSVRTVPRFLTFHDEPRFLRVRLCLHEHKDTIEDLSLNGPFDGFFGNRPVFPCLRHLRFGTTVRRVPLEVLTKSCPNLSHLFIKTQPTDVNDQFEENLRVQEDPSCRWSRLETLTGDLPTLCSMGLLSEVDHLVVMDVIDTKKLFTWLYFVVKDNTPKSLSISLSSDPYIIALEPDVLGQFSHLKALAVTVSFGMFTNPKKEPVFKDAIRLRLAGLVRLLRTLTITHLEIRLELFEEPKDDRDELPLPIMEPRLTATGIVWERRDGHKSEPLRFQRPMDTAIRELDASLLAQWFLQTTLSLNYVFLHQQGYETCWRPVSRDQHGQRVVVEQLPREVGDKFKAEARLHAVSASENYLWRCMA